jgi:signal transduction histidine kinase
MPVELLPFIFDKFRQIDSATTRNYSGAGLGLYIVKNFVSILGARSTYIAKSVKDRCLPLVSSRAGQQRSRKSTRTAEYSRAPYPR